MLHIKKNISTFAVSSPTTFYKAHIVVAFFVATIEAVICKDKGLSNHNGLPHVCCNLSLARRGAIAFFILLPSKFSLHAKDNGNLPASEAQYLADNAHRCSDTHRSYPSNCFRNPERVSIYHTPSYRAQKTGTKIRRTHAYWKFYLPHHVCTHAARNAQKIYKHFTKAPEFARGSLRGVSGLVLFNYLSALHYSMQGCNYHIKYSCYETSMAIPIRCMYPYVHLNRINNKIICCNDKTELQFLDYSGKGFLDEISKLTYVGANICSFSKPLKNECGFENKANEADSS